MLLLIKEEIETMISAEINKNEIRVSKRMPVFYQQ